MFDIEDDGTEDIESICLNCKNEQSIPDFIYAEMGSSQSHKELNNLKIPTLYCGNCGKLKMIPKNYINNKIDAK